MRGLSNCGTRTRRKKKTETNNKKPAVSLGELGRAVLTKRESTSYVRLSGVFTQSSRESFVLDEGRKSCEGGLPLHQGLRERERTDLYRVTSAARRREQESK